MLSTHRPWHRPCHRPSEKPQHYGPKGGLRDAGRCPRTTNLYASLARPSRAPDVLHLAQCEQPVWAGLGTRAVYVSDPKCSTRMPERNAPMSHAPRLECRSCGQAFTAARRDAMTCSGACRSRWHDTRRAALTADLAAIAREEFALKLAA